MRIDAVLKVGGSLGKSEKLIDLCQEIAQLGTRHNLIVVPGGGEFANQVRAAFRRFNLGETTAHRMALLAMDEYGWLLSELVPQGIPVSGLLEAYSVAENGQTPILLPASLVFQADPLPHSWQVTSDTIAAWVAQVAASPRLVLLKDVDGLYFDWPPCGGQGELIPELSVGELARRSGGVDEYLSKYLLSTRLETWVINGSIPGRLTELLDAGQTLGTHIPARAADSSGAGAQR